MHTWWEDEYERSFSGGVIINLLQIKRTGGYKVVAQVFLHKLPYSCHQRIGAQDLDEDQPMEPWQLLPGKDCAVFMLRVFASFIKKYPKMNNNFFSNSPFQFSYQQGTV